MAQSYYDREGSLNTDGKPMFSNEQDLANEEHTRVLLEKEWKCEVHSFGRWSAIDYYAVRHGNMVAVLELKSRTHEKGKYPTVFLNVRKWLALMLAQSGLGCPAVFVVGFVDGLYYVMVSEIDASKITIGGTTRRVKSQTDIEPVINVPIKQLKAIRKV